MRLTFAFASALAVAAVPFADIAAYDTFVPKLVSEKRNVAGDIYPSEVEVRIEYLGAPLDLQLSLRKELFDADWFLETTDEDGVVTRTTDTAPFMCHYNGQVKGVEGSHVTMSLCDELGMRGTVHTDEFDIEIQHGFPLSEFNGARHSKRDFHNEPHIVYSLNDVNVEGILGEPMESTEEQTEETRSAVGDLAVGDLAQRGYNAACITVSDTYRMRAYSSSNAEAQNTQAVVSQANNRYRATSWNGGHTLSISIAGQVQNPSGWSHSSNMNSKLSNLSTYKGRSHPRNDNVIGLTHFTYGPIGLAWINTMCRSDNSCGVNNVGFSSSDNARGSLVAHEIGHNFSFDHDSNNQGGNGFVMWPSLINNVRQFSSYSRSNFDRNRGRYSCL